MSPSPQPRLPRSSAPAPSELFTAVETSRASQAIADQIRGLIQAGRLRVGDRLPSERELCTTFSVSRVTVREAFRILEAMGLVAIKLGATGGAFVTSPSAALVGGSLSDMVTASTMTPEDVTEARRVFEVGIMPLVCDRAEADDIRDLRAMLDAHRAAMRESRYSADMSVEFHTRVAICARNAAIEMLARVLQQPTVAAIRTARSDALKEGTGRKALADYELLVDAIEARDPVAATTVMSALLERSAARLRARRALLEQDDEMFDSRASVAPSPGVTPTAGAPRRVAPRSSPRG